MTEDLSARLAQSCPSYFKEDDKIFYEASSLLQRAEAATAAAEKDHLTRQALKLMMKVGRGFVRHANLLCFAHSRSFEVPARRMHSHSNVNTDQCSADMADAGPAFLRSWTDSEAAGTSWVLRRDP